MNKLHKTSKTMHSKLKE